MYVISIIAFFVFGYITTMIYDFTDYNLDYAIFIISGAIAAVFVICVMIYNELKTVLSKLNSKDDEQLNDKTENADTEDKT